MGATNLECAKHKSIIQQLRAKHHNRDSKIVRPARSGLVFHEELMWTHFFGSQHLVEHELRQEVQDQPIALAAAISEVRSCAQYPSYLFAILRNNRLTDFSGIQLAVHQWATNRAAIWMHEKL